MFIYLVLNTEYGNILSRKLFYLHSLKFCAKNNGIMISYEYMKSHYDGLCRGSSEQLLKSWDLDDIDTIDVENVEQYYFPDSLFESIENKYKSRTESIFGMFEKDIPELRSFLEDIINKINNKHPNEKIEGLFCVQEPLAFVRDVCKNHDIPIIPYFVSALRRPHGYRESLYYVNLNNWLYSSNEPKNRYENFLRESKHKFVLSHHELIALLGKIRTFPLLPYINIKPKYELGVCCEAWSVIPQYFSRGKVTDDDIFYDADKFFTKDQIKVRSHSLQLDEIQVDRTFMHNDPASYLLSCKRLAAVRSQILLKALLWGRTTIAYTDMLGFSYLCAPKINSTEKVDIVALNWYLFGYLIPYDLMFSHEYWRWRLSKPSESEIYERHINHLLDKFGLSFDTIKDNSPNRYRKILENRMHDSELIEILTARYNSDFEDIIDFDNAISKFEINGKSYWRINKVEGSMLICHIEIMNTNFSEFYFYPFDDVAGLGIIHSISINGSEVYKTTEPIFFEKIKGRIDLLPILKRMAQGSNDIVLDIMWESKDMIPFISNAYPSKIIE